MRYYLPSSKHFSFVIINAENTLIIMTIHRNMILVSMLSALLSAGAMAADEPPAGTDSSSEGVAADTEPASVSDDIVLVQDSSGTDDQDETEAGDENADFVPSVQISEDLSVSFPVDI